MKCDICNSNDTYVKDYEHAYIIKGKDIKFISKRRFCSKCNNLVYDAKLDNDASEIAILTYNEKYGISKDEIISLRSKYNLSQDLFAKVIGCAKKTLISYEKGKSIPNDCYMILIKSLISKPEAILTIIDANKEQFTSKELDRLNTKLENISNSTFKLTEFNGYTTFSKEKVFNIISFLASKPILKTKLLKEMFYVDFLCYKKMCKSMTGLEYVKLPYGPVPDQFENILNQSVNDKIISYDIKYKENYEEHDITSKTTFNSTLFTDDELDILNEVYSKFKDYTVKDIVEYSHNEKAYNLTNANSKISYDYAFDIDLK